MIWLRRSESEPAVSCNSICFWLQVFDVVSGPVADVCTTQAFAGIRWHHSGLDVTELKAEFSAIIRCL